MTMRFASHLRTWLLALFAVSKAFAATTLPYTGPAVAIPDNAPAGVNLALSVSGLGAITDLDLHLLGTSGCNATPGNTNAAISHTFVGDLVIRLTSPTGTTATVVNRRGGTRENVCFLRLDDDGGAPALSTITPTSGQSISGDYAPDSPLSAFDGEDPNGQWLLNISDHESVDSGVARRWALVLETVANDIVVDVLGDPNPGSCTPGGCSLREAVNLANARLGPDRILLPASTELQLTRVGADENTNMTGDLDISEDLEIVGAGAAQTILTQTASDRLLHVTGSSEPVRLIVRGVHLQGGHGVAEGGAIKAGSLTITDAVLSDNRASERGGAINVNAGSNGGNRIFLQRVVFNDNEAANVTAADAYGGAIYSISSGFSPEYMIVDDCVFSSNRADDGAGAMALDGVQTFSGNGIRIRGTHFVQNQVSLAGGRGGAIATQVADNGLVDLDIADSLFLQNSVRSISTTSAGEVGGALSTTQGQLRSVRGSRFESNFAYSGGAIHGGVSEIVDSTFVDNHAVESGGAIRRVSGSALTIHRSTLSGNRVTTSSGTALGGGAVAVSGADLNIERSTLDGNTALLGAAIAFGTGDLSLRSNTIVAPSTLLPGSTGSVLRHTGSSNADSLILANNILIGQCTFASAGITLDGAQFNIESPGTTCRLQTAPLQAGNQVSASATAINLAALAENGGPTPTRLPQVPSIALDAGSILACAFSPLDQRGYFRTDSRCDIGAVEAGGLPDRLFADGFGL